MEKWPLKLCVCVFIVRLLCFVVGCRSSTESRRLKNIDRRSGVSMEVTVAGVTVVITDYKPKSSVSRSRASTDSQSSHDTVTSSSPDHNLSHAVSNSVGSPVQSENDRVDPD